jgi:hypothetical protein
VARAPGAEGESQDERSSGHFKSVLDRTLDPVERGDQRWARTQHEHKATREVDGEHSKRVRRRAGAAEGR